MKNEDTLKSLGKIIHNSNLKRDAVHIAVAPVVAGEDLKPGEHVGFDEYGYFIYKDTSRIKKIIGIVDPYLKTTGVIRGEKFWLFLYPGSIFSLRHDWSHPEFNENKDIETRGESEAVIARLAIDAGLSYQEILDAAENFIKNDYSLCEGGRWEGQAFPSDFWDHYEKVTGQEVPKDKKWSFFRCSC